MAYTSGMLKHRVEILKRVQVEGRFGKNSGNVAFVSQGEVWASVDFQRGIKAMRESAFDGTDYVLIRMRFNDVINRNSYIYADGVMYLITEFHRDYQDNIIQIKAVESQDKRVIYVPVHEVEIWSNQACTVRPSGEGARLYAQINKKISSNTSLRNTKSRFNVTFDDYDQLTLVAFRGPGEFVWDANGVAPIEAGTVLELNDVEVRDFSTITEWWFGEILNKIN